MSSIAALLSALGADGLTDPNMIFFASFLVWLVLSCILCKFLSMIFPKR